MIRAMLMVVWCPVVVAASAAPAQLPEVLERAAKYVAQVESTLATVVAEERAAQTAEVNRSLGGSNIGMNGGTGSPILEGSTVRTKRQSVADVLFVRRPAALTWSAVRQVTEIDGKPASAAKGALDALAADSAKLDAAWAGLLAETRKSQLGDADREPRSAFDALALLRQDQQARTAFEKQGEDKIGGVTVWRVGFVEQRGPSLMRSTGNVQVPARGTFWIDPADGRVFRVRLEIGTGITMEQRRFEIDFVPDAALGVLVPSEMKERFENTRGKVETKSTFARWRRPAA